MTSEGSVSRWLEAAKVGSEPAIQQLWERYFEKLVRLARGKLSNSPRRSFDEEDVALSAFRSALNGIAQGRFPKIQDRDDLWRLLVVITARKASDYRQHAGRQKRGAGQTVGENDLAALDGDGLAGLAQFMSLEPTPEFAAMLAEQYEKLLSQVPDEITRRLVELKLEGYTNDEVAALTGVATRTIERKLQLVRVLLALESAGGE
jgi:DNA-directed RNA polymerase specialized sigma24 family protein